MSTADNLVGQVEGDIAPVDGVIRITAIRVNFQVQVPEEMQEKAERLLTSFATGCPAYQSVKESIDVSWTLSMTD